MENSVEAYEYQDQVIEQIKSELDRLQMSYDARILALALAGRGAFLYSLLLQAGHVTEEAMAKQWLSITEQIFQTDVQPQTKALYQGDIIDPERIN